MSVRARLLNASRVSALSFDVLVQRYAIERLLLRLQLSDYRETFILKGAMVFLTWGVDLPRPTRDLDLMGLVQPSPEAVSAMFRDICSVVVEEDGLSFQAGSVTGELIRGE